MLNSLNKFGKSLTALLGEPSLTFAENKDYNLFEGESLSAILPWHSYDDQTHLFFSQKSFGFTIEAIPLVGMSDAIQKELESIYLEILEEGDSLQCLLWADHRLQPFLQKWEKQRENTQEIFAQIAQKRMAHYLNAPGLSSRIFRFILSYSTPNGRGVEQLQSKREKILKMLGQFTYAYSWNIDHFLETLSCFINYSPLKEIQSRQWNPFQTISSQLPCGNQLNIEANSLSWKHSPPIHLKTFRVMDLPKAWSLSEMQALIGDLFRDAFRINEPFFLHYGVHCPKQSKEELNFKKRAHFIEKQGRSNLLLRLIPQLREELYEADSIRKEMVNGSKFLWCQLSAGIWAEKGSLDQTEQSLKSLFRLNQFLLKENRYLHLPSYLAALPMTWGEYVEDLYALNLLRTTISSECAALVPIQGEWMGTPTPGMLLLGRRGQLVNWNPFDNQTGNYNTVVVGRSGSGKSVFMQDLILSGLSTGAKVFVLEVGRSFEKLCGLIEGQQIAFSQTANPICLNPFSNIPQDDEEQQDTAFSFLKSIIATMAAPQEGATDVENALIEKAIRQAWELKQNRATITDVANCLQAYGQNSQLQVNQKATTLSIMLTPYTKEGIYAKYFEGENNVDLTAPFVLIELEELKDKKDLQAVILQLFIMTITNQAFLGDRKTPFYICIDEAWDLLRGKQSGIFIETLARRLRKYNGSLVIGTQSVDDFYSTPGALAAFENSDWICLLAQKASSITRLAENGKIDLDPSKKKALESVHTIHGEYSEVLISDADGNYAVVRLVLDPFSKLLYTTRAQEYAAIKSLVNRGLSTADAINHLIQQGKK